MNRIIKNPKIREYIVKMDETVSNPTTIGILLIFIIIFFGFAITGFQKDNRDILDALKKTSDNTNSIVAKQDETLEAIKKLALDTKTTSEQKTNIIICMLQIPVQFRTTDTVKKCRESVESQTSAQLFNQTDKKPTQQPSQDSTKSKPQSKPQSKPSTPNKPPVSQEEPAPSLLERVGDGVRNVLNGLRDSVSGIINLGG